MNQTTEAGRFSLAGFIFQLLGNGVEAIELYGDVDNVDNPRDVLLLERFGQDSAISDRNGKLKTLNQYKFTSSSGELSRADLRVILEKFLASVKEAHANVSTLKFFITTNLDWKPAAIRLWETKESTSLGDAEQKKQIVEQLIASTEAEELPNASALADILLRTEPVKTDDMKLVEKLHEEAAMFGVLPSEARRRTDEVLGLLLRKSGRDGRRTVYANELYFALTGIPKPYRLLHEDSCELRRHQTDVQRNIETAGRETTPRGVVNDVVRAMQEFPLVVLVGKGGSGKSVVAFDAADLVTVDRSNAPGFANVEKARFLSETRVINSIATWRNQDVAEDGPNFQRALRRLEVVFDWSPKLVVCADGIDEKSGQNSLPPDAGRFIQYQAIASLLKFPTGVWPVTILLTCREKSEWKDFISHAGFVEEKTCKVFTLEQFSPEEMSELTDSLDDAECRNLIRNRITRDFGSLLGTIADDEDLIDPMRFKILRHPVLWGIFKEMDSAERLLFLRNDQDGLLRLAESYFSRFLEKLRRRIPGELGENEVLCALSGAAQSFATSHASNRNYVEHWRRPVIESGSSQPYAKTLFQEAASAGIIRVRSSKNDWCWEHSWFFDYLLARDDV